MPHPSPHPVLPGPRPDARASHRRSARSARWRQAVLLLAVVVLAGAAFVARGAATLPDLVSLATLPLHQSGTRDKPTLVLALSVEYPTVGAQYQDADYSPAHEYLGYFDAESCYDYVNDNDAALRRFERSGTVATARQCGGKAFSGNFMNWATSSAVDVLRLGLTGGDRIVDTAQMTVLQRAVLPDFFWNSSNFVSKRLPARLAADAVPNTLRTGYDGDVYIANCLNRVHFGTAVDGNCGLPGNNAVLGPLARHNLDPSFMACASENSLCDFPGTQEVAYGAGDSFTYATMTLPVDKDSRRLPMRCDSNSFGSIDPAPKIAKACYVRPIGSLPRTVARTDWARRGTYGGKELTSDNFFYTRVRVCESDARGVLQDPRDAALADRQRALCFKYPAGNFKPVGELQKNSDNVRVAAFGYLKHNDNARYGGVLRAPIKYVGGNAYDAGGNLTDGVNTRREWALDTGVFIANPEGAGEGLSGVTNYLNQFGRTGSVPGSYKSYDPVGELYYEALRYTQGLPATPQATAGLTTEMKDGFPIFGTTDRPWTDPHQEGSSSKDYSCVRNNIVLIGDVNTHNDKSIPGNTRTEGHNDFARAANDSGNEPNFVDWTRVVGGFESNHSPGVGYTDGKGVARVTSNPNTTVNTARWGMENQAIGADNASYYIAGMAYWANTHDIRGKQWNDEAKRRPGMRLNTYVLDVNEYNAQSDPDTRRYSNQFFLAAKYGGFDDRSGTGNPFLGSDGQLDNSNWQRQGDNGEANNYFLSSNARSVLKSLSSIFDTIAKKGRGIAGSAQSGTVLRTQSELYEGSFDASAWSGDVTRTPITRTGATVTVATKPDWSAATRLEAMDVAKRNIVVGKTVASTRATATRFLWDEIDDDLKLALNRVSPADAADARGPERLNYLRGDRSLETSTTASTLRRRDKRLGDIIRSGVVLSAAPSAAITTSSYLDFYNSNKGRKPTVFVGANDGMLHGFDGDTGDELLGYIPSWLGPRLSALTVGTYASNHQNYVDATPAVGEAQVGDDWKTVLVGGTGGGGQGVYALDVTDPRAFDPTKVLWEFTDRDDPAMGNVVGQAQIRKLRVTAASATTVAYKWFAIVAGGVNNHAPDGFASADATPALFLLDLSKKAGVAWSEGKNYVKVPLPFDKTLGARSPGVLNFDVSLGLNGDVEYLYAGDLHGQLWKLDFRSSASMKDWTLAKLSGFRQAATNDPVPFFVAKDANGVPQPLSAAPYLANGPQASILAVIGTGKYLESTDNTVSPTTQVQSMYVLYDPLKKPGDTPPAAAIDGRALLRAGEFVDGAVKIADFSLTSATAAGGANTGKRAGWYVDFPHAGERQQNAVAAIGRTLLSASLVPPGSLNQACGTGTSHIYTIDLLTGKGMSAPSSVGVLGPPVLFTLGDGVDSRVDNTGRWTRTLPQQVVQQGSDGVAIGGTVNRTVNLGRLSWRQVSNYRELKNAAP